MGCCLLEYERWWLRRMVVSPLRRGTGNFHGFIVENPTDKDRLLLKH